MKLAPSLTLALLAAGCATTEFGRDIDRANLERIQVGATSKAEVLALLGSPTSAYPQGENEVLVWSHTVAHGRAVVVPFYAASSADSTTETAQVVIGPDGQVLSWDYFGGE